MSKKHTSLFHPAIIAAGISASVLIHRLIRQARRLAFMVAVLVGLQTLTSAAVVYLLIRG